MNLAILLSELRAERERITEAIQALELLSKRSRRPTRFSRAMTPSKDIAATLRTNRHITQDRGLG